MTISSQVTFEQVCEALGFSRTSGLLKIEKIVQAEGLLRTWAKAAEKLGIDAIYFIQTAAHTMDVPVIYFKKLEKYDEAEIINLHKAIWNQGRIPLLFVILPGEVKIYNCFEPPRSKEDEPFETEKRLIYYLRTYMNIEDIRRELAPFANQELTTGRFWQAKKSLFDLNNRADMYLLENLRIIRGVLRKEQLDDKFVHRLIARSILILCLEDRGALTDFFKAFKNGQYGGFREVLLNKEHTYELFGTVNAHFNGDVFPLTEEERNAVSERHLNIIRCFLLGTNPETGQTRLWPYRFDIIPIEFISNIYEEFFHYENQPSQLRTKSGERLGTYYTPQPIVSLMLDVILSWNKSEEYPKLLDPACGSGIYLVEAFKRIINQKILEKEKIDVEELKNVLQNCIFGVDINEEATSIAAFNLYLTILDYVPSESLWQHPKLFPKLINVNLFPVNFFDSFATFNAMKFNYIVGNVPWLSVGEGSNTLALRYCKLIHRTIGDRQLAQAFLLKALNLLHDEGEICLIMGAKSLLFNRGPKSKLFRKELLQNASVQMIVNLSILRRTLFNRSIGPAAIVHCKNKKSLTAEKRRSILYLSPKTSLDTRFTGSIMIDKSDYTTIPLQLAIDDDSIWKIAMWGTPRDRELIARVRSMGTLGKVIGNKSWEIGDGFQKEGSDRNIASWLLNYPHISAKTFTKYRIDERKLGRISDPIFHRPREKKRYTAPLCLIKVTLGEGDIVSAFSPIDVSYTDGIIGISGESDDADILKILCCYMNSDIARYFLFLTCSVWGVERDNIDKDDLLNLPIVLPEKGSEEYSELISIYDKISNLCKLGSSSDNIEIYQKQANRIFHNLLNLNEIETKLIADTISYTIDYYQNRENSIATRPVDNNLLSEYVARSLFLLDPVAKSSNTVVTSRIFSGNDTLKLVSFSFESRSDVLQASEHVQVIIDSEEMKKTLDDLFEHLRRERYENVFLQRMMRIYEGTTVFIIKPNEQRFWTGIEAYRDADETLADIFSIWRQKQLTLKAAESD
jgi:hypothetical protein